MFTEFSFSIFLIQRKALRNDLFKMYLQNMYGHINVRGIHEWY